MRHDIDYHAIFSVLPGVLVVLDRDYQILDVNDCFVDTLGRQRDRVIGRNAFDVLPGNPDDSGDTGPGGLRGSLDQVCATAQPGLITLLRYDMEDPGRPGIFEQRYWSVTCSPLTGDDEQVTMIVVCGHEVTHVISLISAQPGTA